MVIDKNGKVFGKISVIDIIIVLFLIAAVGFAGSRYLFSDTQSALTGSGSEKLEITFYAEEVNDFVVDAISIGDSTMEMAQYASFGTVSDIVVGPSITWSPDTEGNVHAAAKEGYYKSVTLKMNANGSINDVGFSVDGTTYFVGRTIILYVGKAGFQGRIASVERID
ncbi:MAG: DUF4330 domain-containing protein [Oscillospiraceae bacterium]|nr:DUF4330 domain-containing protein [Oscillospiraceae bacterium]